MIYYPLKDFYNEFLDQANSDQYHAYVLPVPILMWRSRIYSYGI